MSSAKDAKRRFVTMLLKLGRQYSLPLAVDRDSETGALRAAFRKIILRVHPDKPGGSEHHTKLLNEAHAAWQGSIRKVYEKYVKRLF